MLWLKATNCSGDEISSKTMSTRRRSDLAERSYFATASALIFPFEHIVAKSMFEPFTMHPFPGLVFKPNPLEHWHRVGRQQCGSNDE
jgi:hypothetical protein